MAKCLIRVLLLTSCLIFLHSAILSQDLRKDRAFFGDKLAEFNHWLEKNQLDHLLFADSIMITANRATLFLRPTYNGRNTCDSLQFAWQRLETLSKKNQKILFHERLLHKWAFLAEVHEDQAEVIVRCHDPAHFRAKIYNKNGQIPVEEQNIRSGTLLDLSLSNSLQEANSGDNTFLFPGKNVNFLCTKARRWLVSYYTNKGTPILWRAKIDTTYTTYDEFVIEVTHLNYEVCPDGYFEYHRIYVKGLQRGEDVELSWHFQGKYGSGIIFPPRKNDYKDMELHYKSNLEEYQRRLFKLLLDHLRQ
ncbi:MAG: hypothetical protein H6576_14645 [Lewinellaceae bacterium]|nr:hypothetical protein [Saprospiraceae bacterium]MCB9344936.1 hypothetical protein [Lewinellaceae bacterium]